MRWPTAAAALTGPLIAGLGGAAAARVAAAVLLYRAATYLLPVPLGALAYLWWRHAPPKQAALSAATLGG
jgi:uncharacterized membrane protein YbhN (UPF0104 family)